MFTDPNAGRPHWRIRQGFGPRRQPTSSRRFPVQALLYGHRRQQGRGIERGA